MSNILSQNRIHKLILNLLFGILLFNIIFCENIPLDKSKVEPIKKYISTFRQGKLLPNRKFELSENPKISVVISIYNEEKNILSAIRSIQNQNLQDIEIVCVNDHSNDTTLSILKKIKEEDPRITIITNRNKRGVIYNRIHGALESKGEYIAFINADDGLCDPEIFEKAYNIANTKYNEKIEIVHYQSCGCQVDNNGEFGDFKLFSTFNENNFDKIIRQTKLEIIIFKKEKISQIQNLFLIKYIKDN